MANKMPTLHSFRRATVCIGNNASTFNDVESLGSILNLTLQLQDLLVQSAASRLAECYSLPLDIFLRSNGLLVVFHAIIAPVVCQNLLSHLAIKWFFRIKVSWFLFLHRGSDLVKHVRLSCLFLLFVDLGSLEKPLKVFDFLFLKLASIIRLFSPPCRGGIQRVCLLSS